MYLLYLDDSGSPKNNQEAYFVLGGCIVPEKSIYWINKHLDDLATQVNSDTPEDVEFHASEIAGGRKEPWSSFSEKGYRYNLIKDVLRVTLIDKSNIEVVACAVEKKYFPEQDPVKIAFEDLISRFQLFLQNKSSSNNKQESGLIILDKSTYETSLQKLAKNFRSLGTKWGVQTNRIQEVPLFVDSKASRAIQLADHVAYSIFRRYQHADLQYYNLLEGHFYSAAHRIHGLAHKTANSSCCTCPACVQRNSTNNSN